MSEQHPARTYEDEKNQMTAIVSPSILNQIVKNLPPECVSGCEHDHGAPPPTPLDSKLLKELMRK